MILQSDGSTYSEDITNCNMATNTALSCTIPVQALRASPYLLPWGSSVFAKVYAINVYGLSLISSAGNGAVIITYADAPLSLSENFALRTATNIGLTWTAGVSNGGSAVLDYQLNYDNGSGTANIVLASGLTGTSYTAVLTSGTTYKFTV
jgi:hypothetical protein